MAQIGTVELSTAGGVVTVPVFDPVDIQSNVYEIIEVETPSGVGVIPTTDVEHAAYDYSEIPTQNNGFIALHDDRIAGYIEDWEFGPSSLDNFTREQSGTGVNSMNDDYYGEFSQQSYPHTGAEKIEFAGDGFYQPNKWSFKWRPDDFDGNTDTLDVGFRLHDPNNQGNYHNAFIRFEADDDGDDSFLYDEDDDGTYERKLDEWGTGLDYVLEFIPDWTNNEIEIHINGSLKYTASIDSAYTNIASFHYQYDIDESVLVYSLDDIRVLL